MLEAIRLVPCSERLLLDPICRGQALADLLAGGFQRDENMLFLITGGTQDCSPMGLPIEPD